ncbi:AAA family ATPase [Pseudorhizobium marinum]|uniref:AAA family ATPase n=1 Tax=Pseudorhizobium marinum TaxID=1496690 RepID=UPI000495294C|nr:ATP-binding protein [Pseudorhizobium marinum]
MNKEEIITRVSEPFEFGIGRRHRFIFADGEIVVDESFNPARIKYSGAREIVVGADIEPDFDASLCNDSRKLRAHHRKTAALLALLKKRIVRPSAAEVGALLLLAEGIDQAAFSLGGLIRALRKRRPIVVITCPVEGFDDRIVELLRRGLILPGESLVSVAGDLAQTSELRAGVRRGARRHVTTIPSAMPADDHDRLAMAVEASLPILCLPLSHEGIPASISAATNVRIRCGHLSKETIEETIEIVTGKKPPALDDIDVSSITLDDLELAVGPGNSAREAAKFLKERAHARFKAAQETARERTILKSGSEASRPVPRQKAGPLVIESMSGYPAPLLEWVSSLEQDLRLWQGGKLPWEEVSSALLVSGPPGTGKTIFVKALANTLQLPLIRTSVSSWMNGGHLNSVINRMTDCFAEARALAPAILFIDEIDGIGSRESQGKDYSDYWTTIVNKLLEALNSLPDMQGLVVVGATNRPEAMDPALLRSGRLQPHLEIGLPDTAALAGIFRHHLGHDVRQVVDTAPHAGGF